MIALRTSGHLVRTELVAAAEAHGIRLGIPSEIAW
jgi:hypothetical protein